MVEPLALLLWGLAQHAAPPCPQGTVLVERDHPDELAFECNDLREGKYCHGYAPDVARAGGDTSHVRVCMDRYEAPNVLGAQPIVMIGGGPAEAWCQRRGKRLCTEQEWEAACEGDAQTPYSYGWAADTTTCNQSRAWIPFDAGKLSAGGDVAAAEAKRLWQGEPSGRRAGCTSQDGVHDLLGNVEEWVRARPGRPHAVSLKGGFWARPWTACRGVNDAHGASFAFYEVGFRCCSEPSP
jgi:formylglycine-generating enzyme required for sulfatase activity